MYHIYHICIIYIIYIANGSTVSLQSVIPVYIAIFPSAKGPPKPTVLLAQDPVLQIPSRKEQC